jgi:hypothetical protein
MEVCAAVHVSLYPLPEQEVRKKDKVRLTIA